MAVKAVPAKGNVLGTLIPARYILAILGSIGMAIVYGLKVNLSVAMVAMLNHTAIQQMNAASASASLLDHEALLVSTTAQPSSSSVDFLVESSTSAAIGIAQLLLLNTTAGAAQALTAAAAEDACSATTAADGSVVDAPENGPFAWSEPLQGTILSCYFWGYFVSQIPGARVAEQFSAKYVMLFSVAINVVCTLLTPVMADASYIAMILMRIGEGIGGGVTFPAMHVMLASWAPPTERSMMSSIVYAGTSLGTVSSMLMAGMLAGSFGWQSVFYVMGGLSCVWLVLWTWLVQDKPALQPLISAEERAYIAESLGETTAGDDEEKETTKMSAAVPPKPEEAKKRTPWRAIFTSPPFWAILVAHACSNWGWYMLLIELPFYMKQVLKFNIKENALATALPFLTMWFFSMALSRTLDALRARGKVSTTMARKASTLCASAVPAACMLALCYIGCQRGLAVLLMGIGITSIGGMFSGFLSNHIDVAPRYAGTLMAITNTAATVPGIVVPIFVGKITHGNQTIEAWRVIFFVTIVLYAIEMVAYTWLGSGEEQPWNKQVETGDDETGGDASTAEITPLNGDEGKKLGSYTDETKI